MDLREVAKRVFGEIATSYAKKGYRYEVSDSSVELWHSDFEEAKMCFVIDTEIFEDKVCFCVYLYPHDRERKAKCVATLEQVLGVGKENFDDESIEDNELFIMLKEYEEVDIADFSLEAFQSYFDKVKERVHSFNDKICQDLEAPDSKLEAFIA